MRIERIEELRLTAATEAEITRLLNRCFDVDFGNRTFYRQRHHVRLVMRAGDRIVGHLALLYRAIRLDKELVDVAGLAEVATDPDRRGEGIAGRLVAAAIDEARATRAQFVLLFGTAALYAAAGFRPIDNPMIWVDLTGCRTGTRQAGLAEGLMVLPLGDAPWLDASPIDLLGDVF